MAVKLLLIYNAVNSESKVAALTIDAVQKVFKNSQLIQKRNRSSMLLKKRKTHVSDGFTALEERHPLQ